MHKMATPSCKAFDELKAICTDYGVKDCYVDKFCIHIVFNSGNVLVYATPVFKKVDNLVDYITSGIHGRVFDHNLKFIGYAPKCSTLEEILIGADMLV